MAASRDERLARALLLHRRGDVEGARQTYEAILEANGSDFDALHLAGVAAAQEGRLAAAVTLISRAIAVNDAMAAAWSNRGCALNAMGRHSQALGDFDRALALEPRYGDAHGNRGAALVGLGRVDEGLVAYEAALSLDPNAAQALIGRGCARLALGRTQASIDDFNRAFALEPEGDRAALLWRLIRAAGAFEAAGRGRLGLAGAHFNLGNALRDLGRPAEAILSFDRAIAARPGYREAHCNRALLLLQRGDFEAGWEAYEWRRRTALLPGSRSFPEARPSLGGDLAQATIFLHWEQGFGDTIQFCRYALLLQAKGARVIVSVQDPLLRLLKQLEPRIAIIGEAEAPEAFDVHCPLMSLPYAFGTRVQTIPAPPAYLGADPALAARWAVRLAGAAGPRIGFAISGRPVNVNDAQRSIALEALAPLLAYPATWVCLHKELREADALALAGLPQVRFHGPDLTDFAETAGLIANLDLVIAVDTGVAHLAAAMGKPVWLMLSEPAEWRWLQGREDSPWYPTARLFRQRRAGDWPEVLRRILGALGEAFAGAGAPGATVRAGGPSSVLSPR